MNTINTLSSISPMQKFIWLLKREYWQHKRKFLLTPLLTGGLLIALFIVSIVSAIFNKAEKGFDITINGNSSNAIDRVADLGQFGDFIILIALGICLLSMTVAMISYALGTLYDERKDRSILFWKSLPISDTQTVLSKLVWTLFLAPIISIVIGFIVGLCLIGIIVISGSYFSENNIMAVLTNAQPFQMLWQVIIVLPIYFLWALPSVGWFIFCSAVSRHSPILTAILAPVIIYISATLFNYIFQSDSLLGTMKYMIKRGLISMMPGSWNAELTQSMVSTPKGGISTIPTEVFRFTQSWQLLGTANLWVGVIIGTLFIMAAIYLRRNNEIVD